MKFTADGELIDNEKPSDVPHLPELEIPNPHEGGDDG